MARIGSLAYGTRIYAGGYTSEMVRRLGGGCKWERRQHPSYDPLLVGPQQETQRRLVQTLSYQFAVPRVLTSPNDPSWVAFTQQETISNPFIEIPKKGTDGPFTERYDGDWYVDQISWDDDEGGELTMVNVQLRNEGEWQ